MCEREGVYVWVCVWRGERADNRVRGRQHLVFTRSGANDVLLGKTLWEARCSFIITFAGLVRLTRTVAAGSRRPTTA